MNLNEYVLFFDKNKKIITVFYIYIYIMYDKIKRGKNDNKYNTEKRHLLAA